SSCPAHVVPGRLEVLLALHSLQGAGMKSIEPTAARATQRRGFSSWRITLVAGLILTTALLALTGIASAATACLDVSCSMTCTPPPPVQISTLIAANQFPATANTPIAFVDPDDGSSRRWVATQQGSVLLWDGADQQVDP